LTDLLQNSDEARSEYHKKQESETHHLL